MRASATPQRREKGKGSLDLRDMGSSGKTRRSGVGTNQLGRNDTCWNMQHGVVGGTYVVYFRKKSAVPAKKKKKRPDLSGV
jgi:hypothetical protein